ncbi:MAG TPA: hypothetical protein VFO83_09135 [Aggregicoccus sp.]|nr:hypothetical protein [Aggregicoccus sp.]
MNELKDEAQRLFLRRKYAACSKLYQRLTELEPDDARLFMRFAEASLRAKANARAAGAYRGAARVLRRQGHLARAAVALKLALALEPEHAGTLTALAEVERQRAVPRPKAAATREQERDEGIDLELAEEASPGAFQVRRISEFAVAVRHGARGLWLLLQSPAPVQTRYLDKIEGASTPEAEAAAAQPEELMSESDFEATYHGGARAGSSPAAPDSAASARGLCLGI